MKRSLINSNIVDYSLYKECMEGNAFKLFIFSFPILIRCMVMMKQREIQITMANDPCLLT